MKKKWALVTGASSGFGKAIAEKLASESMNIILTGRRLERLRILASQLETNFKIETKILNFDIGKKAECEAKFLELGPIADQLEVLVNNAGLALGVDKIQEGKFADWDEMIDTNVKGLLYLTRLTLPHMIAKNSGHIVNIGSVAGRWTYPGGAIYSATKFAVRGITESMRMDLMGKNIRVTNIEPGMAETEFSEVRLGDAKKAKQVYQGVSALSAQDIAEAVSFCVNRPKHVNVSELVIYPTAQAGVGPAYLHREEGALK